MRVGVWEDDCGGVVVWVGLLLLVGRDDVLEDGGGEAEDEFVGVEADPGGPHHKLHVLVLLVVEEGKPQPLTHPPVSPK